METTMPEIDPRPSGDRPEIDARLRRALAPTTVEVERLVARALGRRRSTPRRTLVLIAAAAVLATATFVWQRSSGAGDTRPRPAALKIGELIVVSTPSGEHWIVDRQGASREPGGRHLVVRKEEVQ
jgi:hypothetical protein